KVARGDRRRQRRNAGAILHAAAVAQKEFHLRLREESEVIVLERGTGVLQMLPLAAIGGEPRVEVIVFAPEETVFVNSILLDAQAGRLVRIAPEALRAQNEFIE